MNAAVPLAFRAATGADVPAIVELVESAYRGEASRVGWTTEADFLAGQRTDPEAVAEVVADPLTLVILAERDGLLVGCCQVQHRGDYAYFGMFSVRPAEQGAGLGKELLAEAERHARDVWGVREMRMTVITLREDLLAWYVRRGYAHTGKLEPFPYGDERFGVPLRDDLEFELLVKPLQEDLSALPICEFAFPGPLRDQLVAAVLSGSKTSTTGLLADYEHEGSPVTEVGERSVVIDSQGKPVAIIEVTDVRVVPLAEVDLAHAVDEGEGYETVAQWRAGHERFWHSAEMRAALDDPEFTVDDTTPVIMERFRVIADLR